MILTRVLQLTYRGISMNRLHLEPRLRPRACASRLHGRHVVALPSLTVACVHVQAEEAELAGEVVERTMVRVEEPLHLLLSQASRVGTGAPYSSPRGKWPALSFAVYAGR